MLQALLRKQYRQTNQQHSTATDTDESICLQCGATLMESVEGTHRWSCTHCGAVADRISYELPYEVSHPPPPNIDRLRALAPLVDMVVLERAAQWYQWVKQESLPRILTNDQLMRGCLWLSARERQMIQDFGQDAKTMSALDQFRRQREGSSALLAPTNATQLLEQWLPLIGADLGRTVEPLLYFIVQRIQQHRIIIDHQSPCIAATAVWFVKLQIPHTFESLTKTSLCQCAKITPVTLNKCLWKFFDRYDQFWPSGHFPILHHKPSVRHHTLRVHRKTQSSSLPIPLPDQPVSLTRLG